VTINYGLFINSVVSFLIAAFAVFFVVRGVNRMRREPPAAATKECLYCASIIPIKALRCPHCTSELERA
jgi:large conductance mechanosensitive channel